ncbi:GTP pyrophosphokinase [Hespellia stercorisuis]|uniref:Putative GTP pyrophosphokinase n=1 Tax=Hespellia stercorisuis DSM 15480 TaxID=1121950 RepID=A0A1M6MFJ9_9FIRM|nr:(p)ppGpp synthetase [Hespellia stercorisuis]SHJ82143.1 putative GTP pyrophosphokinase [Hespellia stercorisuis DSM 15480]
MRKKTKEIISIKETDVTIEREEMLEGTLEVNELIPRGVRQGDNMEWIVNMKDQFSQTMDPILRMYNAAMNETTARMEIIKDEFHFRKQRCPIHHIDTRLKSADSILGKLQKKDLDLTLSSACNNIYDIAGVRVVCPYVKDIYLVRERIMAQDDISIMEEKDYVQSPKRNGYRSLHLVIRIPVYFMGKKQMVPVELQIRTLAMDLWASLEHDLKYKSLHQECEIDFTAKLYECSRLIYQAEDEMEKINDLLED